MPRCLPSRLKTSVQGLVCVLAALACAAALHAQDAPLLSPGQSVPATPANGFAGSTLALGSPAGSFWDGGFGKYGSHRHGAGDSAGNSAWSGSSQRGISGMDRSMEFAGPGSVLGGYMKFEPLGRRGPNLRFNSSAGTFRLSYGAMFNARSPGSSGGFGQGQAAASFTSPNFSNGLFNLSATGMYGGRPVTGSIRAGSNSMGSVPGGPKHSGPSVALKLSF
jgi:hypothetical protein